MAKSLLSWQNARKIRGSCNRAKTIWRLSPRNCLHYVNLERLFSRLVAGPIVRWSAICLELSRRKLIDERKWWVYYFQCVYLYFLTIVYLYMAARSPCSSRGRIVDKFCRRGRCRVLLETPFRLGSESSRFGGGEEREGERSITLIFSELFVLRFVLPRLLLLHFLDTAGSLTCATCFFFFFVAIMMNGQHYRVANKAELCFFKLINNYKIDEKF